VGDFLAESMSRRAPCGLVYVTDRMPGIRRIRRGKNFAYQGPDGGWLRDAEERERIRRLAIPPAYRDVWICPLAHGHLQATGRDARGRKQYRYHPDFRGAREAGKFERMLAFGKALPRLRANVTRDLAKHNGQHLSREAVLATLVRLLDTTLMRVGNDEYARANGSYGLTTLLNRHATVQGAVLRLRFRGKSGVVHDVAVEDPRVARIVRRCQALPGQELFQYEDEAGATRCVGSDDVNAYLREAGGEDFSAKDFRTWHASVLALALLSKPAEGGGRPTARQVLDEVASRLGNTPAVCRKSYVHPKILELAESGILEEASPAGPPKSARRALSAAEQRLLALLRP